MAEIDLSSPQFAEHITTYLSISSISGVIPIPQLYRYTLNFFGITESTLPFLQFNEYIHNNFQTHYSQLHGHYIRR